MEKGERGVTSKARGKMTTEGGCIGIRGICICLDEMAGAQHIAKSIEVPIDVETGCSNGKEACFVNAVVIRSRLLRLMLIIHHLSPAS